MADIVLCCDFCLIFIQQWPAGESLEDALRQLYLIDAIDETGQITDVGRMMAGI
jgi:HrpA-like RNA helicase